MKKGKAYIGTSGFYYNHWIGNFYPEDLKKKDWFSFYMEHFHTLELNAPFYRLPKHETFEGWRKKTSEDFIFSVKASRYITHQKKLLEPEQPLSYLFERIDLLEEKLGPVLFQLPPALKFDRKRFSNFLDALPSGYRMTFEFRNHTWYDEEVFDLLSEHNHAFCIYELEYHMSPLITTADWIYIRLHGPEEKYQGYYPESAMGWWAKQISQWQKQGKDVYLYFDNDQNGYAAFNALKLQELCGVKRPVKTKSSLP
jgi:uncharacterized protein YecE (DUF72 family)